MADKQLTVTQTRSTIGAKRNARESLRSLGLKRIHHTVVVADNPVTRGYLKSATHLVTVAEGGHQNSGDQKSKDKS